MLKKKKIPQRVLQGTAVSPGLAIGHAFIYTDILLRDHELYNIKPGNSLDEYGRIEQAIFDVKHELTLSAERIEKELNAQIAGIFLSQVEILKDPQLLRDLRIELESSLVNAEQIVKSVLRRWELRFRQVQDELISYRADDIIDLNRRILRALTGIQAHTLERLPAGSIIVARRLLPSDTVFLSRSSTQGIITEFGGPASHAALLTRELGIPSIGKITAVLDVVHQGEFL